MQNEEISLLQSRLRQLEVRQRRLQAALGSGVVVLAAILFGQCASRTDTVRARSFVVVDGEGRTRATLAVEEDSTRLRLFDEKGTRRASLALTKEGFPGLALFHDGDQPGAILEVGPQGPVLRLHDAKGNTLFRRP
jgi:hypothetical protein